ncbi:MAG: glycosyltransferase family 2 protein [Opitutaceae bacterium]
MKILLATLCLNEMEHLPRLYAQHYDWPWLDRWVFVESADSMYAKANLSLVTDAGLSTDGTSQYLQNLAANDHRVVYVPYGLSKHTDPAQGKVASRQEYMKVAELTRPDFIAVLDADEYYTHHHQKLFAETMKAANERYRGFLLKQRHIWRPTSILHEPLFRREVVGGYWAIPHCRGWRWSHGLHYANNHNTPADIAGRSLDKAIQRYDNYDQAPQCVHLGFASSQLMRSAKHRYYVARGEGVRDQRQRYVNCRAAFETWQPGDELPWRASVVDYHGPIPEIFQHESKVA